jgi:hypothetical protein
MNSSLSILHFDIQLVAAGACRAISHHSGTVVHRYVDLRTSIHLLLTFPIFVDIPSGCVEFNRGFSWAVKCGLDAEDTIQAALNRFHHYDDVRQTSTKAKRCIGESLHLPHLKMVLSGKTRLTEKTNPLSTFAETVYGE